MKIGSGGYPLGRESSMYPGSLRCASSGGLPAQNFVPAPAYSDYVGYHPAPGAESNSHHHHHHGQSSAGWGPHYGAPREDWSAYDPGPSSAVPAPLTGLSPGQVSYSSPDYSSLLPPPPGSGILPSVDTIHRMQISPSNQRHSSYEWMGKTVQSTSTGKTRTKEKYRVVYTDHQRLELEKEFHYNKYITIRRKSELAANLRLSERQVKIWFQNRRAKERKLFKKKITQFDGLGSLHSDSGSVSPVPLSDSVTPVQVPSSLFPPPLPVNGLQHGGSRKQVAVSQ
ncbi:LOW QUALITY PROTEIN: homeobox protein CDX-4-like [Rhinatrema bivittatum]|uniref:LOW QUALITY PROTEIN: homeobox protein CDX-4-like n=1 Tax=Rhinatrema bivittatum TaxID=194408 RepID=UPI00112CF3B2|nr:LOW QUALITY PROTEIN: homeobox protein CDX-4-like [Rhinatrema bivittatum]